MSALPEALPLALAAALYPPALLVLLLLVGGERPRSLVVSYFAGAAFVTVTVALLGIVLLEQVGVDRGHSRIGSAWTDIVLGLLLLLAGVLLWRRRDRQPASPSPRTSGGRFARWSARATTRRGSAIALGIAMYLPSPLYLLALKTIADSDDATAGKVTAALICAVCVLLFVEVPLVGLLVRPEATSARLRSAHGWLVSHSWTLAALLALAAGTAAIVRGVADLV